MTREETVKNLLTELIDMIDNGSQRDLDRADEISKTIIEALSQEPCDDAISREDAIANIYDKYMTIDGAVHDATAKGCMKILRDLPSVTQKSGKWITVTNGRGGHECSLCHEYAPSYQDGDEWLTKYCPNCGAKMESEE